ncbi:MAG: hypothetical protein JNL01_01920 [Bdellovibrionales bacterium]|nr:hypothetical protein [Bdellovibrionales bacterium]
MRIRLAILLTALLFVAEIGSARGVFAAEEACTIEEAAQMLKAETILRRAAAENPEQFTDGAGVSTVDERIADRLRSLTRELTLEYTGAQEGTTESVLRLIRWDRLAGYTQSVAAFTVTSARKGGIATVLAQVAALAAEFTVPTVLVASGHPELAILSPFVPYSVLAHGVKTVACKVSHRASVTALYGSFEDYLETIRIEEAVRKVMGLHSPSDWLAPIEMDDGQFMNIVAGKETFWRKLWSSLGWNNRLTYTSLDQFCKERGLEGKFIEGLRNDRRVPSQLKLVLLLQYLADQKNPEVFFYIRKNFAESFQAAELSSEGTELRNWCLKVAQVTDPETLMEMIHEVPKTATPKQVVALWKEVILPILAERQGLKSIGYFDFRRLYKNLEVLRARAVRQNQWGPVWHKAFIEYLDVSINPKERFCDRFLREPNSSP